MAVILGTHFNRDCKYLRGVSQDEEVFKSQEDYTAELIQLDAGNLNALALFVIRECAVQEHLETHFTHFVEAFYAIEEEDYELGVGQTGVIEVDLVKRVGSNHPHVQLIPVDNREARIDAMEESLRDFLVPVDDIAEINTALKAKDVAAVWFSGVKSLPDNNDHARHLKRLVQVVTDEAGDLDLVKGVMTRLRAAQEEHFGSEWFLI